MKRTRGLTWGPDLRSAWRRWSRAVAPLAYPDLLRPALTERDYQRRHRELVAACEAAADVGAEEQRRRAVLLGELVRPWLSLSQLDRAEPVLVGDLLRQAGDVFGEQVRPGPSVWGLFVKVVLATGLVAGLIWVMSWLGAGPFLARHLPRMGLPEGWPKDEILVVTAALVLAGLAGVLVWRSARPG